MTRKDLSGPESVAGQDHPFDEWVIDGQKIWTSGADRSTGIFVLARTDPAAPRHRGLSFLLVPLDRPGVDVRPIRHMTGGTDFCEVFFTDVRIPVDAIVGEPGDGWKVASTLLTFEPALDIEGLDGLVPTGKGPSKPMRTDDPGADPESSRSWWEVSLNARAGRIHAGTGEVQRTNLAERALGLPRDPRS